MVNPTFVSPVHRCSMHKAGCIFNHMSFALAVEVIALIFPGCTLNAKDGGRSNPLSPCKKKYKRGDPQEKPKGEELTPPKY